MLTEDNLPSYHLTIAAGFGRDGAWGTWVHRWTAEEGRHSIAIRDYLLTTRAVDPVELERTRMSHMENGFTSPYNSPLDLITYVSFQELATRVSHRNTGKISNDMVCEQMLAKVAQDENLHMLFYRNLLVAAMEIAPNATMRSICTIVKTFQMPGAGIANFTRKAVQIALAGIYDLRIHHDEVLAPVLRQLHLSEVGNLNADGELAREELMKFLAELDTNATRFCERREAIKQRTANRN